MAATPSAAPAHPLLRFFRFLGSVQFTLVLLVWAIVAMIAGTLIESRLGGDAGRIAAQESVYQAFWFDAMLWLLMVNLIVAVVNRFPLKRHHASFVVVHTSLVVIGIGAWVTRHSGYEGQLWVSEGQSSQSILTDKSEITLAGDGVDEAFPAPARAGGAPLRSAGDGAPSLLVTGLVADGILSDELTGGGPGDPPGLRFHLTASAAAGGGHSDDWLWAGAAEHSRLDYRMFVIEILPLADPAAFAARAAAQPASQRGYEVVIDGGEAFAPLSIALPAQLGQTLACGDGTTVTALRFAERPTIGPDGIVESAGARLNPAVQVEIVRAGQVQKHTAYSGMPEARIYKPQDEAPLVEAVRLLAPEGASTRPTLSFLIDPAGVLHVQASGPDGRAAARPLALDEAVELPGSASGITIRAGEFLPHAGLEKVVRQPAPGESGRRLASLEIGAEGRSERAWVPFGGQVPVELAGQRWLLGYRQQQIPLPFALHLDDFKIDFHPGSREPSEYSSMVRASALDGATPPLETRISMNRPLDYLGFRLFQSSYRDLDQNGDDETTILSVNYDPGAVVVYWGIGIMIVGIAWFALGDGRKKGRNGRDAHQAAPAGQAAGSPCSAPASASATRTASPELVS